MRKLLFLLVLPLFIVFSSQAQPDTRLQQRLDSMLMVTRDMNLEKILDYTYPKLFTIVKREQMKEALKNSFETEDFSTTLDSIKLVSVLPVFTTKDGQYAKIKHTMLMRMKFKEEMDSTDSDMMIPLMEEEFGKGNVRFDKVTNTIIVFMNSEMVAIKDEFSPEWSFVNYDDESSMVTLLFSKEVIEKMNEYK
jgi:hypothetical protein